MITSLKRIVAPQEAAVTLTEAKQHLRIDFADDDATVQIYLNAAIAKIDGPKGIGRALIEQTWDFYLDDFPHRHYRGREFFGRHNHHDHLTAHGIIEIPLPPLIEIEGIFYQAADGSEVQIDTSVYIVDVESEPARIALTPGSSWPQPRRAPGAVRIRFRAGYLDNSSPPVAAVPDEIRVAILLYLGALYSNRQEVTLEESRINAVLLPWGAAELLRPFNMNNGFA